MSRAGGVAVLEFDREHWAYRWSQWAHSQLSTLLRPRVHNDCSRMRTTHPVNNFGGQSSAQFTIPHA